MNWHRFVELLVCLSPAMVGLIAFLPYWTDIYKGKTRPSQARWWTWTMLTVISTVGKYRAGADWQVIVLPAMLCLAQVTTAVWSVTRGDNDWGWFNSICVVLAILAAVLIWRYTNDPKLVLTLGIVGDGLGFIPTLRHIKAKPQEENYLAWKLGWISALLELFIVTKWNFANAAWPIYYFVAMTITISMLWWYLRQQIRHLNRSFPETE